MVGGSLLSRPAECGGGGVRPGPSLGLDSVPSVDVSGWAAPLGELPKDGQEGPLGRRGGRSESEGVEALLQDLPLDCGQHLGDRRLGETKDLGDLG